LMTDGSERCSEPSAGRLNLLVAKHKRGSR
jgi:hypothetical protein